MLVWLDTFEVFAPTDPSQTMKDSSQAMKDGAPGMKDLSRAMKAGSPAMQDGSPGLKSSQLVTPETRPSAGRLRTLRWRAAAR